MRETFRVLGRNIHPQMVPMKTVQGRTSYTGVCRQMKPVTGLIPQRLTTVEAITTLELKRQPTKGEKGLKRARQLPWRKGHSRGAKCEERSHFQILNTKQERERINQPHSPLSCLSCLLWTKPSQVPACKQALMRFPWPWTLRAQRTLQTKSWRGWEWVAFNTLFYFILF